MNLNGDSRKAIAVFCLLELLDVRGTKYTNKKNDEIRMIILMQKKCLLLLMVMKCLPL